MSKFDLSNFSFISSGFRLAAALLVCQALPAVAQQNPAPHVHGAARLEVAVEENGFQIDFDSPLDNLLGFEHAPNTDQQRQTVKDMATRLQQADQLFISSSAAKCQLESVKLNAPVLPADLLGNATSSALNAEPTTEEHGDGHAELEAAIVFRCANPAALKSLDVQLFKAFPNLHKLDAAVVTAKGQTGAKLSPKDNRLSWQ